MTPSDPDQRHSALPQDAESGDSGAAQAAVSGGIDPDGALSGQGVSEGRVPSGGLKLFLTTFVTIFVAELGDKTQLTTLLMSAESQAPLTVFLGSGSALILTTLIGVLVGRWLSSRVSVDTLETTTGVILAFISLLLLWDVVHL
ncbi:MAG: TMEM165/GDT1 family protein [Elainellaceae cyanobacterium]